MKQRLVVVGNGMAGMRTVDEVLALSAEQFDIVVFGAEPYGNYNRIMLSPVLCGEKTVDEIITHDRQWYRDHNITLHAGMDKQVVRIDRIKREVIAADGTAAGYDRLLIATGSNPFILPVPGNTLRGVVPFRDIANVETMLLYAASCRHAVVLGGGLLGLEAANGLIERGMQVTVVHSNTVLLNRQLDSEAATLLQAELERRGVKFKMPAQTDCLLDDGAGNVCGVRFADGNELPCDLFVMAVGVRPNVRLAKQAGIYCEKGIVVNDALQTYDPRVYAVGECVQHRQQTFGLVAPLFEQAKVCANHLCGWGIADYQTLPIATKLKVTGIHVFSVGDFLGGDDTELLVFRDVERGVYKKLVLKNNRIVGVVLYGQTQDGGWYQQLLEGGVDISPVRHLLVFGRACAEPVLQLGDKSEASDDIEADDIKAESVA